MARKAYPASYDILETIERVQGEISGRSFADFQNEWTLRFAIQHAIETILEASRRLPEELIARRRK